MDKTIPVTKKRIIRKKTEPSESKDATKEPVNEEVKPSCPVCIEPYNKVANTQVTCSFCNVSSCRRCIQTFMVTSTNDPHCMHCKRAYDREFIDDNLTATYRMGEYKKHRENILLDREVALLPATQYRAEQIREADKLESEIIVPLNSQITEVAKKMNELQKDMNKLYGIKNDTIYQCRMLRTGKGKREKNEITFVRKCPDGECRGFLSTQWKCGLCSKWACSECHEIKGTTKDVEHTCKEENVATAKLLAKDSRPCPGCGTVITKIEGCDQMWCPQCHTAFSWRTGQKETGVIHNPHFYEFQRRQNGGVAPRVAGDVACGGIPHYSTLRSKLNGIGSIPKEVNIFLEFHRVLNHTLHVEIARMHNVFNELDNEDLRIEYLLGRITKEQIKVAIQIRERKREKERAMRRIFEVLVQAGSDLLNRVINETNVETKRSILIEIEGLRKFINELLAKINERMKLSVPQYASDWTITHPFSASAKKLEQERIKKEQVEKERQAQRAVLEATRLEATRLEATRLQSEQL